MSYSNEVMTHLDQSISTDSVKNVRLDWKGDWKGDWKIRVKLDFLNFCMKMSISEGWRGEGCTAGLPEK